MTLESLIKTPRRFALTMVFIAFPATTALNLLALAVMEYFT